MARNEIRTAGYSFQGHDAKRGYRIKALIIFLICFIVTLQVTAQFIAYQFEHHPALGWRTGVGEFQIYPFYRAACWLYELMRAYEKSRSNLAAMSAFVFASGLLLPTSAKFSPKVSNTKGSQKTQGTTFLSF